MKTADTAHTGIFAMTPGPVPDLLGGAWGRGLCMIMCYTSYEHVYA